jgi:hypothetical protein
MKKHRLLLPALLALAVSTKAQVGIGITTPDPSAQLHVESSTKGVLVTRVTSTANVTSPAKGLIVYQTGGTEGFYYNAGTSTTPSWVLLLSDVTGVKLAPSAQQQVTTTNTLINLKLNGGASTLGTSGTSDLLSLSAAGTYSSGALDKEWFRVDNAGGVLAQGTWDGENEVVGVGTIPFTGNGTRMMWYGAKGAFRVGYTNNGSWDDANVGQGSFAGGMNNRASGRLSTVFGNANVVSGIQSTAFGSNNTVSGTNSFATGSLNTISGNNSFAHGSQNTISSSANSGAFVMGLLSQANASQAFSIGERATVSNTRAMVISLGPSFGVATNDAGTSTLTVRAANGIYLGTNTGTPSIPSGVFIQTSTGAYLTSTGVWTNTSDRALKENFKEVDGEEILQKISSLPITTWNYRKEGHVRHLGPMAQDFAAAFQLGDSDKSISTVDEGGVAIAGVKALVERSTKQQEAINELKKENAELKSRLDKLEQLVQDLTKAKN